MDKSADAFRTISEVAEELDLPQHVLRFWETRFPQIKPLKRAGGRRFYRPNDIEILRAIRRLLYSEGYTIKGVQRILKEQGARAVIGAGSATPGTAPAAGTQASAAVEQTGAAWSADPFEQPSAISAEGGFVEDSDAVPLTGEAGVIAFRAEIVERLKAVLRELEECERVLDAVRRPPAL